MRCVAIGSSADAGSSISRISGRTASARAMHKPLLLPSRQGERGLVQPVLHLVPERGVLEAFLDALREVGPIRGHAVDADAVRDVFEDRLRKRIRFLEHHAHTPPQVDHVGAAPVDVLVVDAHVALGARADDDVVHAVEGAQEGALAAARRSDEGRHLVCMQGDRDVVQDVGSRHSRSSGFRPGS